MIRTITEDVEQHRDPHTYWPEHPLDQLKHSAPRIFTSLYLGAAGVLWALNYLHNAGAISLSIDPAALMPSVHDTYIKSPDTDQVAPSYFLGEVGIALIRWRLTPDESTAQRIFDQVKANLSNPANEAFWAALGTMLAALWMTRWTGESRWLELSRLNAEYLWQEWHYDPKWDCYLWTQDLYNSINRWTGPAHGYAGSLYALLQGVEWLPAEQQNELYKRAAQLVIQTARVKENTANWHPKVRRYWRVNRMGVTGLALLWGKPLK